MIYPSLSKGCFYPFSTQYEACLAVVGRRTFTLTKYIVFPDLLEEISSFLWIQFKSKSQAVHALLTIIIFFD